MIIGALIAAAVGAHAFKRGVLDMRAWERANRIRAAVSSVSGHNTGNLTDRQRNNAARWLRYGSTPFQEHWGAAEARDAGALPPRGVSDEAYVREILDGKHDIRWEPEIRAERQLEADFQRAERHAEATHNRNERRAERDHDRSQRALEAAEERRFRWGQR